MIKVLIEKNKLTVTGHADFNNSGFDIVCAGVSVAVTMSVNMIEVFGYQDNIEANIQPGDAQIVIVKNNDEITKIINTLVFTLKDLELQYPKYIKIKENL